MERVDAIVFDMDGLMFDTEKIWIDASERANNEFGYNVPKEIVIDCIGLREDKSIKKIIECMGDDFDIKKYLDLINKLMIKDIQNNGIRIKKGLVELLEFLKSKKIKLAVASSSSTDKIKQRFKEANVSLDYFDYIIGGEKVVSPKPNPEIYLNACEVLGVEPRNALALEDSEFGILSAFRAGMRVVWVPDIKMPSKEVQKVVHKKVNSLDELISLFK